MMKTDQRHCWLFVRVALLIGFWLALFSNPSYSQNPISLGAGSYAAYPPLHEAEKPYYTGTDAWGDLTQKMVNRKLYVVDTTTRAIPSTDWWTTLITTQYSDNLWAYPGMVNAENYGLYIEFPKTWSADGRTLQAASRLTVGGLDFAPESALARRWGAYTLDWVMKDQSDPTKQMAVTIGHGLPFTWIECSKLSPTITLDAASFFKDDGSALTFPVTTDHFGINLNGDHYGIFAPPNTTFTQSGRTITVTFPSTNGYLVVGTMTKAADLSLFNTYAYTLPRDSKVSWVYNEETAKMDITWELVPENLRGQAQNQFIQGWLPHAYKKTTRNFSFNGLEYVTPRGKLKMAIGNKFVITYPFNGLLPGYPTPEVMSGIKNPYNPAVVNELVNNYKSKTGYGTDTYWGGKDLLNYARYMQLAAQTGNTEAFNIFKGRLKEALTDWYTYTPGENSHYFSWYTNWGSFLGHNTRDNHLPGIDVLQDHAFCYAYHIYAAAILFMYDEDFMMKYKDFVKMQVLDYANYNRSDKRFPFFRSMDPWAGHSYSGGMGDFNGNGEESSSEGMQAWGAMYLLGVVTNDKPLRDAAIFGYVQEAQGVAEYWFDRSHIPANGGQGNYDYTKYDKPYNSNLTSNGIGWWTYFSGDNFWMHSIQWLPMSPFLKYMYEDQEFARWDYATMWSGKTVGGWDSDLGTTPDIGAITLSYLQVFDPDSAASVYDRLWAQGKATAKASDNNTFSYWFMHSHRTLGEIQWNQHTNIPSSTVYFNARLNRTTVVVYNPSATEQLCKVYRDGVQYASFMAPPKKLIAHRLDAALSSIKVTAPKITVPSGQTLQFTQQGFDQYESKLNTTVTWSVSGGGSINGSGLFTAGSTNGTYVVSAKSGSITGTFSVRVGPAPVLTTINITPTVARADIGKTYQFAATGVDQYGDPFTIAPTWSVTGGGSITAAGIFTPSTPGGPFTLRATSGSVNGSLAINVSYPLSNIALSKTIVGVSSASTENPAANLTDGNFESRWETAWADPQWITVDLGGVFDIERVVLTWEAAYGKVYSIQLSNDNNTFSTVYNQPSGFGGKEDIALTGTGRYVKLYVTTRATAWGVSLYEMEVYGMPQKTGGAVLSTLMITPSTIQMKDNVTQQFTARGYDQFGNLMTVNPQWSVIGKGAINASGVYTPNGGGVYLQPSFNIIAKQNNLVASATVVVEEVPKLMKLDILPLSKATKRIEMPVGSSQQFTFNGENQFGVPFTGTINWTTSGGGTVNASGVYTANQLGEFMIFGRNGAVADTAFVSVKPFAEVNLAAYKIAKASSAEGEGTAPGFAVDVDMTTRWSSAWSDLQWISVDLKAAYKLNRVNLFWEGIASAKNYEIQVSNDNLSWQTVYSTTTGDGGTDAITFAETPGRYIRMNASVRNSGYGYALYEFQVFGTGIVGNQLPTTSITSPSNNASFTGLNPITINANASDADGTVSKVEFYINGNLQSTDTSSPYTATWTPSSAGSYAITSRAYDNLNGMTTSAPVSITVMVSNGATIPGKVESESYATMSGIAMESTTDTGGGQNIGYIDSGDWMDYAVNVQATGNYNVTFRTAGWNTAGQLQLRSGATILATISVPNTGGGQVWATTTAVSVPLVAGNQTLRVHVVTGGFNLNWMNFATTGGNISPSVSITAPVNSAAITGLNPVTINATASDPDGTISKVEFYVNAVLQSTDISAPFSASWTPTAAGSFSLTAKAFDNLNANTTSTAVNVTVTTGGSGSSIPGKIEAESYATMSGVAKEGTVDAGGGENIGYIDAGDWMDYMVNVQAAGTYAVQFRLAGWAANAQLQLRNGATVLATVNVPNTGGGQVWATTASQNVTLAAGNTTLRVNVVNGGFNFNWMNFTNAGARVSTQAEEENTIVGYPNPSEDQFALVGVEDGTTIVVSDVAGKQVMSTKLKDGVISTRELMPGAYLVQVYGEQKLTILRMNKK